MEVINTDMGTCYEIQFRIYYILGLEQTRYVLNKLLTSLLVQGIEIDQKSMKNNNKNIRKLHYRNNQKSIYW